MSETPCPTSALTLLEAMPHGYGLFLCGCGSQKVIRVSHVKAGAIRSCGRSCPLKVRSARTRYPKLHAIWREMKSRCRDRKNKAYHRYGGRGISVDPGWGDFEEFRCWSEANGYAEGLELDRIDNDLGYGPGNCRFVSHMVNCANRAATIMHKGGRLCEQAHARGLNLRTVTARRLRGWPEERWLEPVRR